MNNIKEKSIEILEKYSLTEPPINPNYIAEEEGLTVVLRSFPEPHQDISGFIHYASKTIYINKLETFLPRRVFTLAHELGHYFLHQDWIKTQEYKVSMRNTSFKIGFSSQEKEANTFAANLLVPKFLLDKYKQISSRTYYLAILFGVSQPVIKFRLEQEYGR